MNGLQAFTFLDALGFTVLRTLISLVWQSSLLIGIAAAASGMLRRRSSSVRHSVWASLICLLPLVPLLVWVASYTGAPQMELPVIPMYSTQAASDGEPAAALSTEPVQTADTHTPRLSDYPWAIGLVMYIAGVLLFLYALAFSRFRLWRWIRHGTPVSDPRVLATFRAMGDSLGISRIVSVIESGAITAPLTIGAVRPVILLPRGFSQKLSGPELRSLAVHELSHVKRYDSLVLTVVAVVRALLFFNPLIWLAAREVAVLAESACDDAVVDVVNEPVAYAEMLTHLAVTLPRRLFTTELAAGFSISKHLFLRRIELILIERKERFRRLSKAAFAGIVSVLLVSFTFVISFPLGCGNKDGVSVDRKTFSVPLGSIKADEGLDLEALKRFMRWMITIDMNDPSNLATINGTVIDPEGKPVHGATVAPATGTVRDINGNPMANQPVRAHAADKMGNRYYDPLTKTDEQGHYVLRLIRPGRHLIQGTSKLPPEKYAPDNLIKRVTLKAGEMRKGIDLIGMTDDELLKNMKKPDLSDDFTF